MRLCFAGWLFLRPVLSDVVSYRPCQRLACGLMGRPDKHGLHAVIVGYSRPARNCPFDLVFAGHGTILTRCRLRPGRVCMGYENKD